MTRLSWIFLLSFILFANLVSKPVGFFQVKKISSFLKQQKLRLEKQYKNPTLAPLSMAYLFGEKRWLKKVQRRIHKNLGIQHLLTPSGLHLSSLFLIFFLIKKRKRWLILLPCLGIFCCSGFYSLKRIICWKLLHHFLNKLGLRISLFFSFLVSFSLDFLFGTFLSSALSFAYSFLFLGTLLSLQGKARFKLVFFLHAAYAMTLFFTGSSVLFSHLFFNFFLSSLFSLIFPFLMLSFWVYLPSHEFLISLFSQLLLILETFSSKGPTYHPSFLILLGFFFLTLKKTPRWVPLIPLLLVSSLNPFPWSFSNNLPKKIYSLPAKTEFKKSLSQKSSLKVLFKNKIACTKNFPEKTFFWRCRKK